MSRKRGALFGLLLLYWFTRLHELEALAFFLDEAAHADWARSIWQGHLFQAASDGKLLNVFSIAVLWPFNASVWAARASGVLTGTVGFACLLALCFRLFSARAAILSGLLYIFLPLSFFYDRMALADPFSAAGAAITLWAVGRLFLLRRPSRQTLWWVLSGLSLNVAVFSKISNLVFLCIPATAVILLPLREWQRGLKSALSVYVAFAAMAGPLAVIVWRVGQSDLGLDLLAIKTVKAFFEPAATMIAVQKFMSFAPFPLWPVIVVGAVISPWRGGRASWWIGCVTAISLGALLMRSTSATTESRYLVAYGPLIVSLAGSGLATLTQKWRPTWSVVGAVVMISAGAQFMWLGWYRPQALPLPDQDRWQYISGWPAGYGFREIADDWIARNEPTQLATLDVGGRQRFEGYLLGGTGQVTAQRYKPGMPLTESLLIIDTPKDDQELAGLGLTLKEIARYPRPGGESALVVYRVTP